MCLLPIWIAPNTMILKRVTGQGFIRLFLQHVQPKRFVKIRHYGFLSTRSKQVYLHKIRNVLDHFMF